MRPICLLSAALLALGGCVGGSIEGRVAIPPADRELPCGGRRIVAVPQSEEAAGIMRIAVTENRSAVDAVMNGPLAGVARSATCEGTRYRIDGLAPGRWTVFTDPKVTDGRVMQIMQFVDVVAGETATVGGIIP
jgi:hypothetical protein